MARREWADKVIETYQCGPCRGKVHVEDVAKLFTNEHARAVRIVKRLQKNAERGGFGLAYGVALKDVLAALTKGRA